MTRRRSMIALALAASWCAAQAATTQPASAPAATPATAPAADPAVMKILKALEAAGEKYATLRAEVTVEVVDRLVGDSEKRTGWVAYQKGDAKTSARFRVHFDTLKQGAGRTIRKKLDYAFDGHFLTVAKHSIKDMTRYQVVAEGEKAEPMRLGKGPFPVPFGQKADDVIEHFNVKTRPVKADEPKGTIYLKLTPRRDYYRKTDVKRLEMWIDPKTNLPIKLVSRDKKKTITTVTFARLRTNVKFDRRKMFHMPRPLLWTYHVQPLKK